MNRDPRCASSVSRLIAQIAHRLALGSALLIVLALTGCGSMPADGNKPDVVDQPCSCMQGAKRCVGTGLQICERVSDSCASWGPTVACSTGMCKDASCGGSCTDGCTAGAARCSLDSQREVCRLTGSGCLDWVADSCPGEQYCVGDQCVDSVPCAAGCPAGYMCQKNGVCAGGSPTSVVLNVQTVSFGGSITVNGAAPVIDSTVCSTTKNPYYTKANVHLVETTKGYSFDFPLGECQTGGFTFSGRVFPGTYRVSVQGYYDSSTGKPFTTIPTTAFISETALAIPTDLTNKVLNVQTVSFGGSVTVNSAAPAADSTVCSTTKNPYYTKANVHLVETTKGYQFDFTLGECQTSGFTFSGKVFPGTYRVSVEGYYDSSTGKPFTTIPTAAFISESALAIPADLTNKVLNVQTVSFGGSVTVNSAAPVVDSTVCSTTKNPYYTKATVHLVETTKGYQFDFSLGDCQTPGFTFSGKVFPGTYRVSVQGSYDSSSGKPFTTIPTSSFISETALAIPADLTNKVLNVQTVSFGGSVTVNSAAPAADSTVCSTTKNPYYTKANVHLVETTKGYQFDFTLGDCQTSGFTFSGKVFPGTYRVSVQGYYDSSTGKPFTTIPTTDYISESALAIPADLTNKVLNVQTVSFGGTVTVNSAAPVVDSTVCSTTKNPYYTKANVHLVETTKGYQFDFTLGQCQTAGFTFSGKVFPGTYRVSVQGYYDSSTGKPFTTIPTTDYISESALAIPADLTNKVLNVQTVSFGGSVTVNGAAPVADSTVCSTTKNPYYTKANVRLVETAKGYQFDFTLGDCQSAGFTFSGKVFPGTYRVSVQGYYDSGTGKPFTSIPTTEFTAVDRLLIP